MQLKHLLIINAIISLAYALGGLFVPDFWGPVDPIENGLNFYF